MSRPWMPLYIGDYHADTMHLTTLQHGAYLLLIMHYWQHGSLPNDEEAIARISRLNRDQWRSNCKALAKLFLPGWKHKRVEDELQKANDLSAKRAIYGYKGGKASRGKSNYERFEDQAIAKQKGTQSQSHIDSSISPEPEKAVAPKVADQKKIITASPELERSLKNRGWAMA